MSHPILKKLESKFTLHETYLYEGTYEELKVILKQLTETRQNFDIHFKESDIYVITANLYFGTMPYSPIGIFFQHRQLRENIQQVDIYSTIRPELYFLLATAVIISGISIRQTNSLWPLLIVPAGFLICVTFFNFIYRIQQRSLIKDVKRLMKLKEVA